MERSIPEGRPGAARADLQADRSRAGRLTVATGLVVVLVMLAVYTFSNSNRHNFYNHFVWQASAWLEGEIGIRYPVEAGPGTAGNTYFQDVFPLTDENGLGTGRALIPFPPLPAIFLVPFVALWGVAANAQTLALVIGAIDVGIAFWMLGRLRLGPRARLASTLFLGLGTVLWYAAMLGTTWFFAHVVAVGFTLLAIGLALDGEAGEPLGAVMPSRRAPGGLRSWLSFPELDGRQFAAGFLFGLACTARLTVLFGFPFFILVGGRDVRVRAVSAGLGAMLPILALLGYNLVATGHAFSPVYEYLYQLEANGYPFLNYNPQWSIEDLRYVPQNLAIMLLSGANVMPPCDPGAVRGLFDKACPFALPDPVGTSLLLTSPGWLLALPALRWIRVNRIVAGATIAVVAIAFVNLMHFSQGWVQFGYRFSNDFAPFAIILVGLTLQSARRLWPVAVVLVGLSIAVNLWGVAWGGILGW